MGPLFSATQNICVHLLQPVKSCPWPIAPKWAISFKPRPKAAHPIGYVLRYFRSFASEAPFPNWLMGSPISTPLRTNQMHAGAGRAGACPCDHKLRYFLSPCLMSSAQSVRCSNRSCDGEEADVMRPHRWMV